MKKIIILAGLFFAFSAIAQETKRPDNWFNLDATKNNVNGVSSERSYEELLKGKKSTTIIVGVLDSGYRGEVSFRFKKTPNHTPLEYSKRYEIGDKIGQIMIIPYPKVEFTVTEQLLDSERGTGSYGSSGV